MTPEELNLSKDDSASSTVDEWSARLGIPASTLLHHAGRNELKVFFPPVGANFVPRYVSVEGFDTASFDIEIPPALPSEALTGSPYLAGKLYGIYLDGPRCAELCKSPQIRVTFHREMLHNTQPSIVVISSEQNTWGRDLPSDTRIAIFPTIAPDYFTQEEGKKIPIAHHIKHQAWNRSAEEYLRTPISFLVEARHVRIRDIDMADFLSRITTFAFIDEMFDGVVIADALPSFVSKKLLELISANRQFWSGSAGLNTEEREARRKESLIYLSGTFKSYCNKQSGPAEAVKFAAEACDPYMVSAEHSLLPKTTVTRWMLGLLTASKLFLSASEALGGKATQEKEAIVAFLRSMELKEKPGTAATLLMPERSPRNPK